MRAFVPAAPFVAARTAARAAAHASLLRRRVDDLRLRPFRRAAGRCARVGTRVGDVGVAVGEPRRVRGHQRDGGDGDDDGNNDDDEEYNYDGGGVGGGSSRSGGGGVRVGKLEGVGLGGMIVPIARADSRREVQQETAGLLSFSGGQAMPGASGDSAELSGSLSSGTSRSSTRDAKRSTVFFDAPDPPPNASASSFGRKDTQASLDHSSTPSFSSSPSASEVGSPPQPIKFRVGLPHTPETRRKISDANKGNIPWNKGKKHTMETRRKIAEATRIAMSKPETRRRLQIIATGRKHSVQTRIRIAKSCVLTKSGVTSQSDIDYTSSSLFPVGSMSMRSLRKKRLIAPFAYLPGMKASLNEVVHNRMRRLMEQSQENKESEKLKAKRSMSAETRAKLSARIKELWADPDYRKRVSNGLKETLDKNGGRRRPLSESHRRRIRETLLRRNAEKKGISFAEAELLCDERKMRDSRPKGIGETVKRTAMDRDPMAGSIHSYLHMTKEEEKKSRADGAKAQAVLDENSKKARVALSKKALQNQRRRKAAARQAEIDRVQSQLLLQSLASAGQLPPLSDDDAKIGLTSADAGELLVDSQSSGANPMIPLDFDIYAMSSLSEFEQDDDSEDDEDVDEENGHDDNVDIDFGKDGILVVSSGSDAIDGLTESVSAGPARGIYHALDSLGHFVSDPIEAADKDILHMALDAPGLITDEIDDSDVLPPSSRANTASRHVVEDDDSFLFGYGDAEEEEEDDDDDDDGDGTYDADDGNESRLDKSDSSGSGLLVRSIEMPGDGLRNDVATAQDKLGEFSDAWSERSFSSKSQERKRIVTYVNGKAEYVETQ